MKHETEGKKMLGTFNGRLDKGICITSLLIISVISATIASLDIFSLFNICGVFKQ